MNGKTKILLIATLLVMVVGIGLAVIQPGSLGDSGDEAATPPDETTTTVTDDTSTTTDTSTTSSTTTPDDTSTTEGNEVEDSESSNTTRPGSGLGSSGTAEPGDTSDGLAATGGRSLILVGLALGASGLLARRRHMRSA